MPRLRGSVPVVNPILAIAYRAVRSCGAQLQRNLVFISECGGLCQLIPMSKRSHDIAIRIRITELLRHQQYSTWIHSPVSTWIFEAAGFMLCDAELLLQLGLVLFGDSRCIGLPCSCIVSRVKNVGQCNDETARERFSTVLSGLGCRTVLTEDAFRRTGLNPLSCSRVEGT